MKTRKTKSRRSQQRMFSTLVARKITEDVCEQFMDWLGRGKDPAPFGLKSDVFSRVERVLNEGVEC